MTVQAKALADPGLSILEMLLRVQGNDIAPDQIQLKCDSHPADVAALLRCVRRLGLKAVNIRTQWDRLPLLSLPGIAPLRDGGFVLLGSANERAAVVVSSGMERPIVVSRCDFEALWTRQLILVQSRKSVNATIVRIARSWPPRITAWRNRVLGTRAPIRPPRSIVEGVTSIVRSPARTVNTFADRARKMGKAAALPRSIGDHPGRDELAFLPAALEIVESPPSPLGRATSFGIVAIFLVALTWACFGTVDIVAIAPGKFISSGRNKIIQPFDTGLVRSISVSDGQRVKAGDPLIFMICQMIGLPPISTNGFGTTDVCSLRRVPYPPAKITTFMDRSCVVALLHGRAAR